MSIWATSRFTPRGEMGRFIEAHITPAVRASVQASCTMIQDRAKELCPVDTGRLRDSIQTRIEETQWAIKGYIFPDTPYAGYVEFGTGIRGAASPGAGSGPYSPTWPGMPAQPYLRPAVDESRDAVRELFKSNISVGAHSPYA